MYHSRMPREWHIVGQNISLGGRTLIMGVLNAERYTGQF